MSEAIQVVVRPAELEDQAFILSSWLRGQRFGNAYPTHLMPFYFERVPSDAYYEGYKEVINRIVCMPGMLVDVAADIKNRNWVVGFAVYRTPDLYWVFVKPEFRKQGIANLLLKDKGIQVAKSTTKVGYAIGQKKGLVFNPF